MNISDVLQEQINYDEKEERDTLTSEENNVTGHELEV